MNIKLIRKWVLLASQHYLAIAANADHDLNWLCWSCVGTYPQGLQPSRSVIHPTVEGEVAVQTPERSGQAHHQSRSHGLEEVCPARAYNPKFNYRKNLRNCQGGINCWRQDPLQTEDPFPGWTYFLCSDCSAGLISPCTRIIHTRFSQLLLLPDSKSLLSVIYEENISNKRW